MPLPLVVFIHNNSDVNALNVTTTALAQLYTKGYRNLCVEHPASYSAEVMINLERRALIASQLLVSEVFARGKVPFNSQLLELPFPELKQRLSFLERGTHDFAMLMKMVIPMGISLSQMTSWKEKGGNICGMCSEEDKQEENALLAVRINDQYAFDQAKMTEHNKMCAEIQKHYATGEGTVVLLTVANFPAMLERLKKMGIADNSIFVFPRSSSWMGDPAMEVLSKMGLGNIKPDLTGVVDTEGQRTQLITRFFDLLTQKQALSLQPRGYTPQANQASVAAITTSLQTLQLAPAAAATSKNAPT